MLFLVVALSAASAQVASHAPALPLQPARASVATPPVGRPLVRVNGAVLTDHDLQREIVSIFPYARQHNGLPKAMESDIRNGALKMIVFEELVYQEAERRKMTIPAAQLTRGLAQFRQQFATPQEYQQYLQEECQGSAAALRAKIKRSLLIDKFLKLEVTDKAAVSVTAARAYYEKNPDRFRIPESFAFQSVSILPPPKATAAQLAEVHKRAEDALRQAKATKNYEDFGLLAEKLSDDDFRVMMGDHKAADRSKLPPAVVAALAAMQPGQLSGLIEFDANCYTILRLNAHIPAGMQKFADVSQAVREQLKNEKTESLRSALAARLSKNAKIEKL